VIRAALAVAREIVDEAERVQLSERDSLRALELLENPPSPNKKLRQPRAPCRGPRDLSAMA
jgi:uncharacterized protein (DUF1778 family)